MQGDPRYIREYSLIIGTPEIITQPQSRTFDPNDPASTYNIGSLFPGTIRPEIQEANFIEINDAQIEAYLPQNKTRNVTSRDKGYINIYNLDNNTRDFILTDTKEKLVFLRAGYRADIELPYVFVGSLLTGKAETKLPDHILKLTLDQSLRAGRDVRIQKTYRAGTAFALILNDLLELARTNGFEIGRVRLPPAEGQFYQDLGVVRTETGTRIDQSQIEQRFINRPLPVEGYILDILESVCKMVGYRSYMVLNKIYVEPEDAPQLFEVFQVSTDQIQGSIQPATTSKTDRTGQGKVAELSINLFLNGNITVNKRLQILDGEYKGLYSITKVEHMLNLEKKSDNAWTTSVIARIIN